MPCIRSFMCLMFFLSIFLYAAQSDSYSAAGPGRQSIEIKRFSGTVRVVLPDSGSVTASQGEEMPYVPSGSKIEVLSGKADVSVNGKPYIVLARQAICFRQDGCVEVRPMNETESVDISDQSAKTAPVVSAVQTQQ